MILDFAGLDIENNGNKYKIIYTNIKSAVARGAIKSGERLPSVREAAAQLKVSRTTVENAYTRLCIEGIAESRPNRGYYIIDAVKNEQSKEHSHVLYLPKTKYDFSSRRVDTLLADTDIWRKLLRSVLRDSDVLTSYGDPQGEIELREALAAYAYRSRGVIAEASNIVIGAGVGPLLNILCGIMGRKVKVGMENGGFKEAESIFDDYGIKSVLLESDRNGAIIKDIYEKKVDALFLLPSSLSKISVNGISRRRLEIQEWLSEDDSRIVIEDDYNGELRYSARSLPAFRSKTTEGCVYIGSFSKLLLPSVRIAYMVLPTAFAEIFNKRKAYYNQTCGKTEQLALAKYITDGNMEKQLRRLRRMYYGKSRFLCRELENGITDLKELVLYESSLIVELKTTLKADSRYICEIAFKNGIKIMPSNENGAVKLCFAGIGEADIPDAVKSLNDLLAKIKYKKC